MRVVSRSIDKSVRVLVLAQVCKFYLQGRCTAGDRCRYAHPATPTSRVEQNQAGGRNAVQQSGARRLLVPPPPPAPAAAAHQHGGGNDGGSGSTKQRLGAAGRSVDGATEAADAAAAEDRAPPRPAWGPASSKAQARDQPGKSGSLAAAFGAAEFVPASAPQPLPKDPWAGSAAAAAWEGQHEGRAAEQAQHFGGYSEAADFSQSGDQQGWYGLGEQDEDAEGWYEDGQQWPPAVEVDEAGEGLSGSYADAAEEAPEQQFGELQVEADPHAQDAGQPGDWRLLCEVRPALLHRAAPLC